MPLNNNVNIIYIIFTIELVLKNNTFLYFLFSNLSTTLSSIIYVTIHILYHIRGVQKKYKLVLIIKY